MEDVPIFQPKQTAPLARPEDLDDDLLLKSMTLNMGKNESLTPSPDEGIEEEEVKF